MLLVLKILNRNPDIFISLMENHPVGMGVVCLVQERSIEEVWITETTKSVQT